MNLKSTFEALLGRQETGIATITGEHGGGSYTATTQGGAEVVLTGSAAVGKKVFYDARSGRILREAPAHRVTDIVL